MRRDEPLLRAPEEPPLPLRDEPLLERERELVERERDVLLRDEPDFDELARDEPERVEPERDELDRDRPLELVLFERPLVERLLVPFRLVDRDRPEDLELLLELERRVERRRRVVLARWARGTSARTTSLTRRPSSASRNLAIRSSSRLIALASWAVSRSPTASAKIWIRE